MPGYYTIPSESIAEVIRLWAKEDRRTDPDAPIDAWYPPRDLLPYRRPLDALKDHKRPGHLTRLAESIKTQGFDPEHPVKLRVARDGSAIVIDGNHRLLMAFAFGVEDVPVNFVFVGTTQDTEVRAAVEDVEAQDLGNGTVRYTNKNSGRFVDLKEADIASISVSAGLWGPGKYSACEEMNSSGEFSFDVLARVLDELRDAVERSQDIIHNVEEEERAEAEASRQELIAAVALLDSIIKQLRHIE